MKLANPYRESMSRCRTPLVSEAELLLVAGMIDRIEQQEARAAGKASPVNAAGHRGRKGKTKAKPVEDWACVTLSIAEWSAVLAATSTGCLVSHVRQSISRQLQGRTGNVTIENTRAGFSAIASELLRAGKALNAGREIVIQLSQQGKKGQS